MIGSRMKKRVRVVTFALAADGHGGIICPNHAHQGYVPGNRDILKSVGFYFVVQA